MYLFLTLNCASHTGGPEKVSWLFQGMAEGLAWGDPPKVGLASAYVP